MQKDERIFFYRVFFYFALTECFTGFSLFFFVFSFVVIVVVRFFFALESH